MTVTGGSLEGTSTVIRGSSEPFSDGEHGLITCVVYAKKLDKGIIDLEAPCTTVGVSGDSFDTLSKRSAGDVRVGGGDEGRFVLLGGTGKYAGVTGVCAYGTKYLPNDRLVTTAECEWQRL